MLSLFKPHYRFLAGATSYNAIYMLIIMTLLALLAIAYATTSAADDVTKLSPEAKFFLITMATQVERPIF